MPLRVRTLLSTALLISLPLAASAAQKHASSMHITDAWSMPSLKGAKHGVAYATITNTGDIADTLERITTPAAGRTELHTQETSGDIVRMREIREPSIPSASPLSMKPGGMHIMLMDLKQELKAGETFPMQFHFTHAGEVPVEVAVHARQPEAQDAPHPMHDHH